MPDTPSPPQESTIEAKSRRWLTFVVVIISVTGVVALGITTLVVKSPGTNDPFEKVKYVSATILPLLASWVGTILAFYFSKENLMAATQSVTDLSKAITGIDKLKSIPVREKMRPLSEIKFEQVLNGGEAKVKLSDLLKKYTNVERIIILDDKNVVRFLIYKSMVERYLSRIATDPALLPAGVAIADLTLKHLFDSDSQMRVLFETSFGFVRVDATLADAKQVMDKIPKCQDVFVTQTGDPKEPIIGWVTDNAILENAKL
jgi:hypothetical protein